MRGSLIPATNMPGLSCAILSSSSDIEKDRCFAWIVCAASMFSHMMSAGFTYAIAGTLTLVQQKHFNITENDASWIISVHFCFFSMMGEFYLANLYKTDYWVLTIKVIAQ